MGTDIIVWKLPVSFHPWAIPLAECNRKIIPSHFPSFICFSSTRSLHISLGRGDRGKGEWAQVREASHRLVLAVSGTGRSGRRPGPRGAPGLSRGIATTLERLPQRVHAENRFRPHQHSRTTPPSWPFTWYTERDRALCVMPIAFGPRS